MCVFYYIRAANANCDVMEPLYYLRLEYEGKQCHVFILSQIKTFFNTMNMALRCLPSDFVAFKYILLHHIITPVSRSNVVA